MTGSRIFPKNKKIPFNDWTTHMLKNLLGYVRVEQSVLLTDWLAVAGQVPVEIQTFLKQRRDYYLDFIAVWNEIELLTRFISPLVDAVRFDGLYYNSFMGRKLKAKVGEYELFGETDWMAAFGVDEPEIPYFFIHEYKRLKGTESDPFGQLLAGMIAAQAMNQDKKPVYGLLVLGRYWHFVVLEGNQYALSAAYDATNLEELCQIWLILQKRKLAIEAEVNAYIEARLKKG